ncbi:MAG TPA: hypothetical protein VJ550_04075 [Geomonas sp.]|nr:hypothetical protein [Geomonas sp.]
MKRNMAPTAIAMVILLAALTGCSTLYRGVEGNIYEKMTVFSMIVIVVFAILFVPFVTGIGGDKDLARFRGAIWKAAAQPLSPEELTSHPAYLWDSPNSFYKRVFAADGSLWESPIVTVNGLDPEVERSGSWTLGEDGVLRITMETGCLKNYTPISRCAFGLATVMRLETGFAEAWYLGERGLAHAQISCFGYSRSLPPAGRFTVPLVSGATVYWATYPCCALASGDELSVNPALAYGAMTFHPDGTLARSRDNRVEGRPDYTASFSGTWRIDEVYGVLDLTIGPYTREIKLFLPGSEPGSFLVGTTEGSEQWFLDPGHGREQLASYLALGAYLDGGKAELFV